MGLQLFQYLFQTVNYNGFTPEFNSQANYYGMVSGGYYIQPFNQKLKIELSLNGTITRFGLAPILVPKYKWRHKYWKYGIQLGITYNFLTVTPSSGCKHL